MSRSKILIRVWMVYFTILIPTLIFTPMIITESSDDINITPFAFLVVLFTVHGALTVFNGRVLKKFQFKSENVTNYFGNERIIVEEEGVSNTETNKVPWYFNKILSANESYNLNLKLAYVITSLLFYLIAFFLFTLFTSIRILVCLFIIDILYHLFFIFRGISNFFLRKDELRQIGKEIFKR